MTMISSMDQPLSARRRKRRANRRFKRCPGFIERIKVYAPDIVVDQSLTCSVAQCVPTFSTYSSFSALASAFMSLAGKCVQAARSPCGPYC